MAVAIKNENKEFIIPEKIQLRYIRTGSTMLS